MQLLPRKQEKKEKDGRVEKENQRPCPLFPSRLHVKNTLVRSEPNQVSVFSQESATYLLSGHHRLLSGSDQTIYCLSLYQNAYSPLFERQMRKQRVISWPRLPPPP